MKAATNHNAAVRDAMQGVRTSPLHPNRPHQLGLWSATKCDAATMDAATESEALGRCLGEGAE
jgi:hypothetical protein